ncbi:MAG: phosphatase PAP2 family protein, partial [Bacteroidia bacterium]
MLESLEHIDRSIFSAINGCHNSYADLFMEYVSSVFIWIPFYMLLAWLLYKSIGKKIVVALLCAGLMVVCCDQSANLIKNSVKRYRPSHNLELQKEIHLVNNYKGGQYGFVSGHAANTFGLAFFLIF